ncbi:MAG: sodium:solute symporter family protein [Bacilli bacterium]
MEHAFAWIIVLSLAVYTAVLIGLSTRAKRRVGEGEAYLHGGRQFGFRNVFILVTVMWASSIFVVELETGFLSGLSAIWFGVSVIVMSVLVARFLLKPFREVGYVTNSRLLGQRFGASVQSISAAVIALTFPIFAMSNVLAAAEFLHALLGFGLPVTLVLTTVIMLTYIGQSGLWSLAYTQTVNLVMLTAGIGVAVFFFLRIPKTSLHPVAVHGFNSLTGVGTGAIAVWLVMNIFNSVSAQAEMQAIAAVKDTRIGQRAVYVSAIVLVAFTVVPVWLGMRTREMYPNATKGLAAFPVALAHSAPPWAVLVVALGVWSAALAWCAPLLFSGASSLGADLFRRRTLDRAGFLAQGSNVRRLTQYGLLIQGALVIVVALLRPDELAWWRVFGQTIRSAAIFAPTIAFFLWPTATKRAVLWSMSLGVASSLLWNAGTGFSATAFLWGVNPMWVGLSVSVIALVVATVLEMAITGQHMEWKRNNRTTMLLAFAVIFWATLIVLWSPAPGLRGALFCSGVVVAFMAVTMGVRRTAAAVPGVSSECAS